LPADRAIIIVTDAEARSALAVIRSLGARGHHIEACSASPTALAFQSRFTKRSHVVPDARQQPEAFREAICEIARTSGAGYILPVSDASCTAILPHRGHFPCEVLGPHGEVFLRASNKEWLLDKSRQFGLEVPPQVRLEPGRGEEAAALGFPLVLKPHRSVGRSPGNSVLHISNADRLEAALASYPLDSFPLLAQRRIIGPGRGIFLLRVGGRIVARFAHERLIESPPSGGHSVLARSTGIDEALCEKVERLLSWMDWEGPAMAEFKVDRRSGTPYLMELNGRFWGSLQLAIDAGVNFPDLWLTAIEGGALRNGAYAVGMRERTIFGLLEHLKARLWHSANELSLPPDAPRISNVVAAFFPFPGGGHYDTFRLDDPGPFFAEGRAWLHYGAARLMKSPDPERR
jgi:predicted ATP-grasp superfamily ATP-dependent carboligase